MKKILLVDDAINMRELITEILSPDYNITSVSNGKKALDLLQSENFDLIITDVLMPEMDGFELLMELRKIKPEQKTIAISGEKLSKNFDPLQTIQKLMKCPILRKPFHTSELRAIVNEIIA